MRIFGPNLNMMRYSLTSGKTANEPIVHPWITRAIEKAQQRVEKQHFETRKNLLRYADVLNAQRGTMYTERRTILNQDDMRPFVAHTIDMMVSNHCRHACTRKKTQLYHQGTRCRHAEHYIGK